MVSMGIMKICPKEAPRFIKTQTPIHILCLPPAYSATSQHFHLPPHYAIHELTINISLSTANIISRIQNMAAIRGPLDGTQPHHLVNIPLVPIDQLSNTPFLSTDESIDDTAFIWTLFSHTGIYVMAIGLFIPAGLGIFFCYFF